MATYTLDELKKESKKTYNIGELRAMNYGAPPVVEPEEKKDGFFKGLVKSIANPVIKTVAAPFQAVASAYQYSKDPLKEADVDFSLPFFGKFEPPKTVKEQVGNSLQTVSLGLGPAVGGATMGAGMALEQDKSIPETLAYTAGGGILGKAGDWGFKILGRGLEKVGTTSFNQISRNLEKSSLPLTSLQKSNMTKELDRATNFLLNQNIKGNNPQRYEAVSRMINQFETKLQEFLQRNNTAKGVSVSKQGLIDSLEKMKPKLMRDNPDAGAIDKQITAAIENIKSQYRFEKIPVSRLNVLKRETYGNAYNKAGDK